MLRLRAWPFNVVDTYARDALVCYMWYTSYRGCLFLSLRISTVGGSAIVVTTVL